MNRRVYFYPFETREEKEKLFQEELNKLFGGTVEERQKRLKSDDKYMGHK